MKFVKVLFCFFECLIISILLASCNKTSSLAVPGNFKIEGSIISFDELSDVLYRIEAENVETGSVIRRFVNNLDDLNNLDIPEGEYKIKIQSVSKDKTVYSEYSDTLTYIQKDLYMTKELKEQKLVYSDYIKWMGRTLYDEESKSNTLFYSASGFEVMVKKDEEPLKLEALIHATNTSNQSKQPYLVIVKDHDFENTITVCIKQKDLTLSLIGDGGFIIDDDLVHTISVYKRSESIDSHVSIEKLNTNGKFLNNLTVKKRKIEVIAASSSTGYGNLGNPQSNKSTSNSDALHAFAFLSAQALDAEVNIVSASGWGIYASRWTSPNTINMYERYKYVDVFNDTLWDVSKYTPDVIVTNFGTNDLSYINLATTEKEKALRRENFIQNYVLFLEYLNKTYKNAKIVILYGLMQESGIYADTIEIYNRAKATISDLEILKVEGDALGCASHPSVASHEKIASLLAKKIQDIMNW